MIKVSAWVCLVLGITALSGGTFTNIGSASNICLPTQLPPGSFVQSVTGTNINLTCPNGYVGVVVSASVGDLSANGSTSYGPTGGLPVPGFSLQSTFTDSLMPVGGSGSGTVEFTLTYTWSGLNDLGFDQGSADLLFNGSSTHAWDFQSHACLTPPEVWCPGGISALTRTEVATVDEPVTYGVPFSYQADLLLSGGGSGLLGTSNQLVVSTSLLTGGQLVELPEPASLGFCAIGAFSLLLRLFAHRHRAS